MTHVYTLPGMQLALHALLAALLAGALILHSCDGGGGGGSESYPDPEIHTYDTPTRLHERPNETTIPYDPDAPGEQPEQQ